jgi:periplasmic copper chaperone A
MIRTLIMASTALAIGATTGFAHITLENTEAHVGGSYKAVFRVGHGCEGKPTKVVKLQIPEGVISAKPMPKPGWTVEKVKGAYGKSYTYFDSEVKEGIKEITWKGGSLPDDEYDEFVVRVYLTTDLPVGQMLYFPIVQECPDGAAERWIEIPPAGKTADDLEFPAPGIMLLEKTSH